MPEPIALDGEPTFELMGRDPFAPALIRLWVAQRRQDVWNGVRPVADLDQIERAERMAERMETWRSEADEAWRSPRLPMDVDGTLYTPGEPEADKDGWIAWSGGKCPVPPYLTVEVRQRDEYGLISLAEKLSDPEEWGTDCWDWSTGNPDDHIVAYKVVAP